jgi:hypothetical protein
MVLPNLYYSVGLVLTNLYYYVKYFVGYYPILTILSSVLKGIPYKTLDRIVKIGQYQSHRLVKIGQYQSHRIVKIGFNILWDWYYPIFTILSRVL